MKRLVFVFIFIVTAFNHIIAQSGTRYTSFYTPKGQIIFFKPHAVAAKGCKAKFEYDMTYQENNDTIILTFSFIAATPTKINGLKIKNPTLDVEPNRIKRLYTDLHKRKYTTRMQATFNYEELKRILTSSVPYYFEIMTDKDELFLFEDGKSTWKKENKRLNEVFNLTTINN